MDPLKLDNKDTAFFLLLIFSMLVSMAIPSIRNNDVIRVGVCIIHMIILSNYIVGTFVLKAIEDLRLELEKERE